MVRLVQLNVGRLTLMSHVIPDRILERGKSGLNLILGVSKGTIERNVLEPMRDFWGEDLVGRINSENIAILFGEKVYCLGAEKVSQGWPKLRGAKFKYAYCDELVEYNEEVFALLKSRLSLHTVCVISQVTHHIRHIGSKRSLTVMLIYIISHGPYTTIRSCHLHMCGRLNVNIKERYIMTVIS